MKEMLLSLAKKSIANIIFEDYGAIGFSLDMTHSCNHVPPGNLATK